MQTKSILIKTIICSAHATLALGTFWVNPCGAQANQEHYAGYEAQAENIANTAHHPRLPVLSTFDQKTVQTLVDTVETIPNASILQYGYFMRRGTPPLPQADGYNLVVAALGKEPVASKRWFVLQTVRAFAAFRVRDVSSDDGYVAYNAIFEHAADASKAAATPVLRQAIVAYVFLVPGRIVDMRLLSDARTGALLIKAWKVYTTSVPPAKVGLPEPPWTAAIQRAKLEKAFLPIVEKTLRDPTVSRTYGLLKTVAIVYQLTSPTRAIALLQQAGPLLPKDAAETRWYYSTLTIWLSDSGKLPQAISAAEAEMKATGQGQGTLALLQFKSGDITGLQATLMALSLPDASQLEMNAAADGLDDLYSANHVKNKVAGDQAVSLLSQYLSGSRPRDIEQELHARGTLAGLLIQQSRFDEAKTVLTAGHYILPLPTTGANDDYLTLQQILTELNSKNTNAKDNVQK